MATDKISMAVHVACPAEGCGSVIPVPFTAEFVLQGDRQYLDFEPDMTDLWAHAWSHGAEGNFGDLEK